MTDDTLVVFHGTSVAHLDRILEEGLGNCHEGNCHEGMLWLTDDPQLAELFAMYRVAANRAGVAGRAAERLEGSTAEGVVLSAWVWRRSLELHEVFEIPGYRGTEFTRATPIPGEGVEIHKRFPIDPLDDHAVLSKVRGIFLEQLRGGGDQL